MIAPIETDFPALTPRKKRRAQQAVEVRVVVEVQMPPWMQQMQQQYSADPSRGRLQEAESVVPKYQDASGSAVFVTTSEQAAPATVRTSSESFQGDLIPLEEDTMSLVQLYDRLLSEQDREKRVRASTIQANRSFLRKFEAWAAARNDTRNTTPRVGPLKTLELSGILKEYARHLRSKDSGASESMCTKALAAIGKLAGACQRAGLITARPDKPSRPSIKLLKPRTELERRTKAVPVSIDELKAMLSVVDGCQWPQLGKVSAAKFWETCLLSHYAYGFRSQDWFAVRDQWKQGLLWSGVITDTKCPVLEDLHNAHGWAWYLVHKTDTKDEEADRPSDVLVPLSAELRSLIEQFRGLDPVRVFPLPQTHRSYDREFSEILSRAGLSDESRVAAGKPIIRLSLGQRNVASFRKGCSALWAKQVGRAASSYLLHHAVSEEGVSKTTTESYLQHEEVLREIVPAIDQLPIWRLS
jgi:hypothetical protein